MTITDTQLKLTPKQKKIITNLRDGWSLVASSEVKGCWVSKGRGYDDYYIDGGVFWRLVNKGLVYQQAGGSFEYVLTAFGKTIKL